MGSTNWTELTNGLSINSVDRGVTTGIARPNGGGSFIFGFNSMTTATGAAGYFANQVNFAPGAKGGSIRGAVQRGISGGVTNFSPFLFICGQGPDVGDSAYILGLQDDDPHRIVLRKGSIIAGVPNASPGSDGILRRSTATYTPGTWHHLRMDAVVNTNGDVILKVFRSDLSTRAVTAPIWSAVPGIEDSTITSTHGAGTAFVDDGLGVNSGSASYTSGRFGFAFSVSDVTRRGYFDHIEVYRQL